MNVIKAFVRDALKDEYFFELLSKCETIYANDFFKKVIDGQELLNIDEFFDILRFADILAYDESSSGRNYACKVVSLLYPRWHHNDDFKYHANAILTRLGNFPSLYLITNGSLNYDIFETELEKTIKQELHKAPDSNKVFTDTQYRLFDEIKNSNHYSFSGPTSFGKSFILDSFIKYLIEERTGLDNIVILVPTRALINQVSNRLRQEIKEPGYRVLTHPKVPGIYRSSQSRFIFIFTPERLISYFSNKENPAVQYMFIDEAQKIVEDYDARSPLYYHAISMADKRSVKLFFASPNISNADIFLRLFDKSIDESMSITESPVTQNRFFVDLINKEEWYFYEKKNPVRQTGKLKYNDLNELLSLCGKGDKNVVYCNSINDTIECALSFANGLPDKQDNRLTELVKYVKESIHEDYYLIDCLKKGVAFHFGRLPQNVREKVEALFIEGGLDYLFCTSTLLEGVNLPAKNIFILSNKIGLSNFSKIDFWNLAGRAGRLSKELSGNIICVRHLANRWQIKDVYNIMAEKSVEEIKPIILTGRDAFYKNIDSSLSGEQFTRKNTSQNKEEFFNSFANIIYSQEVSGTDSLLISNYVKKSSHSNQILAEIDKTNNVQASILEQSITIKPRIQNKILSKLKNGNSGYSFPEEITYEACEAFLEHLYDMYEWSHEESKGTRAMAKSSRNLRYLAVLMNAWINSKPLNLIIKSTLRHYAKENIIWNPHTREDESFDAGSRSHINIAINELVADIDNFLRFRIKNYVVNYQLLNATLKYHRQGINWADYLEYGTTKPSVIALQELGLSRHLANVIEDKYSAYILIEENEIKYIELAGLSEQLVHDKKQDELNELRAILSSG